MVPTDLKTVGRGNRAGGGGGGGPASGPGLLLVQPGPVRHAPTASPPGGRHAIAARQGLAQSSEYDEPPDCLQHHGLSEQHLRSDGRCHHRRTRQGVSLDPSHWVIKIDEVPPGKGSLDYETFLLRISQLDQDTVLTIEHLRDVGVSGTAASPNFVYYSTDSRIIQAKNYIQRMAQRIGVVFD